MEGFRCSARVGEDRESRPRKIYGDHQLLSRRNSSRPAPALTKRWPAASSPEMSPSASASGAVDGGQSGNEIGADQCGVGIGGGAGVDASHEESALQRES